MQGVPGPRTGLETAEPFSRPIEIVAVRQQGDKGLLDNRFELCARFARCCGVQIAHANLAGKQRCELDPGLVADRQFLGRHAFKILGDRFAGCLREDERDEETRVEIVHESRLPFSQPLFPNLAQQLGGGASQPRHDRAKPRQFTQWQGLLRADSGGQMCDSPAASRDDHLMAGFHLVQKFAEARFRLSQIDRNHGNLMWS